ncbi:uncharacterized protein SAPINGB_P002777 [Magnusiomyces paraingens]|uniref:Thioredoxin domain-containing protein n=1 Tax=Magnusiomyces paraingens TaxID=2606893 RepID=A0A5E8BHG5_9ASCO|nr:uncharacterized protein SAPINGB_P002777 [Saprochaete ingens]VVT50479.1 unnamed protein product [Saprochaete ingens]
MPVIPITSDEHFASLASTVDPSTLVVIYFHTPWAAPCAQMNSVFQSLSDAHASPSGTPTPSAIFLSVNADDFPDISESFDVSAVPYFVLVRDATILKELSGADPKELATAIESQLAGSSAARSVAGNVAGQGLQSASGSGVAGSNASTPSTATAGSASSAGAATGQEKTQGGNTAEAEEHEETEAELNERLSKLVSAAPVMLFMKGTPAAPACGFSRQMVALLRENQVRFGFFDILKDNSVRQGLKAFSDWPTYPQLYVNGELQGGLDIIKESLTEDPDFFKTALEQAS